MNREVWDNLIEKYLKNNLTTGEKDQLLDESLRVLNEISKMVHQNRFRRLN